MIPALFNILFFLIPLVFFKNTSELFEFNKIVTLYAFTTLIMASWLYGSIINKKFIFRRTILDWPLIIYLSIYLVSSLLSIDPRTSWLGYYSRFNGGLVSQVCYALLYWAFVSNLNKKQSLCTMFYALCSTAVASLLAVAEHFGIFTTCGLMGFGWKESCWVQDVQNRVFSTLGQPNWLASLLVALLPITWSQMLLKLQITNYKLQIYNIFWFLISVLFFVILLFTKSRSGLLAFGIESIIFWGFIFWKERFKFFKEFIFIFLSFSFLAFVFNPSLVTRNLPETASNGPALETGGTESGTIRKYVWAGALEVFKHYPILGTGPETFAFSFPMFKPVEHNLTSEWDFIYNKAHNEFLNLLANVGLLGFLSFMSIIIFSLLQITNYSKCSNFKNYLGQLGKLDQLEIGLLSGYIAILVTNFFGFSVVPVSLLFFLFPAIAIIHSEENTEHGKNTKLNVNQKIAVIFALCTMFYVLFCIAKYWQADIYYNKSEVDKALEISPNEAVFVSKLAFINGKNESAFKALSLNPYNQNIRKILISNLVKNSETDENNLLLAEDVIKDGIKISPFDPKLYYQLGLLQIKIGKDDDGIASLEKSVSLKPNYKESRFALGMTYKAIKEYGKAKEQLEYILKNIDPKDDLTKKYLEEVKN